MATFIDGNVVVAPATTEWENTSKGAPTEHRIYPNRGLEIFDLGFQYDTNYKDENMGENWCESANLTSIAEQCSSWMESGGEEEEEEENHWASMLGYLPGVPTNKKRSSADMDEDADQNADDPGNTDDQSCKKPRKEARIWSDFPLEPEYRKLFGEAFNKATDLHSNDPQKKKAAADYLRCGQWIFGHKKEEKILSQLEMVAKEGKTTKE